MSTELEAQGSKRCGICLHWVPTEDSLDFIVFRDGVERSIMFGVCELKSSNPDSECVCPAFEKNVEKIDDEEVVHFIKIMEEANEALVHFKTTGDRSKFKAWHKKYGG